MDHLTARLPCPGTPGEWIRLLLSEAQARGTLTSVRPSFTDQRDSAGDAWSVLDEAPTITGNLAKFVDALDVRAELSPDGLSLHAWSKGSQQALR